MKREFEKCKRNDQANKRTQKGCGVKWSAGLFNFFSSNNYNFWQPFVISPTLGSTVPYFQEETDPKKLRGYLFNTNEHDGQGDA